MRTPSKQKLTAWWRREIRPLLVLCLCLFAFRSAIADWNDVPTGSMKPTILEGDRVCVNKLAYDLKAPFTTWHLASWTEPRRGDVIVFYSPEDGIRLVKRVAGLPGDRIELRENRLWVNGQPADYGSLDPAVSSQVQAPERAAATFATETVEGRTHAVMGLPSVAALRTVPEPVFPSGPYFVLGDHRYKPQASRYIGVLPWEAYLGRGWAVGLSVAPSRRYFPRVTRSVRALG